VTSDYKWEGSGLLGLPVAKTIVELHDGELELISEGQGTCVHIKQYNFVMPYLIDI
jgi:signal transduction histidine kinase